MLASAVPPCPSADLNPPYLPHICLLQSTLWVGAIDASSPVYTDPPTGLTIRHVSGGSQGATISICRFAGPETRQSCCEAFDNDCNDQVSVDLLLSRYYCSDSDLGCF